MTAEPWSGDPQHVYVAVGDAAAAAVAKVRRQQEAERAEQLRREEERKREHEERLTAEKHEQALRAAEISRRVETDVAEGRLFIARQGCLEIGGLEWEQGTAEACLDTVSVAIVDAGGDDAQVAIECARLGQRVEHLSSVQRSATVTRCVPALKSRIETLLAEGEFRPAQDSCEILGQFAPESPDLSEIREHINAVVGQHHCHQGNPQLAAVYLDAIRLTRFDEIEWVDRSLISSCLTERGLVAVEIGSLEEARDALERAETVETSAETRALSQAINKFEKERVRQSRQTKRLDRDVPARAAVGIGLGGVGTLTVGLLLSLSAEATNSSIESEPHSRGELEVMVERGTTLSRVGPIMMAVGGILAVVGGVSFAVARQDTFASSRSYGTPTVVWRVYVSPQHLGVAIQW